MKRLFTDGSLLLVDSEGVTVYFTDGDEVVTVIRMSMATTEELYRKLTKALNIKTKGVVKI